MPFFQYWHTFLKGHLIPNSFLPFRRARHDCLDKIMLFTQMCVTNSEHGVLEEFWDGAWRASIVEFHVPSPLGSFDLQVISDGLMFQIMMVACVGAPSIQLTCTWKQAKSIITLTSSWARYIWASQQTIPVFYYQSCQQSLCVWFLSGPAATLMPIGTRGHILVLTIISMYRRSNELKLNWRMQCQTSG